MENRQSKFFMDFLRFVFSVMIVLFHSRMLTANFSDRIVLNGASAVEFFCILSGCLMCASSAKKNYTGNIAAETYDFMKHKISRLMPNFLLGCLIAFGVYHYNAHVTSIKVIVLDFIKYLPELLLIKNSGIRLPSYNGVTWYLSAMLLNMLVLYPLLRKYKDSFFIIALALLLFILGNFYQKYGTLCDLENWNGFMLKGTIRCTAGLLAGCICYKAATALGRNRFTPLGKLLFSFIEWGCYITAIYISCKMVASKWDYLLFLLYMIGIAITFSNISFDGYIFNSKVFSWFGAFSYSLYMGHSCWREFTNNIYPKAWTFKQRLICYLIVSFINALIIHYLSIGMRQINHKYGEKVKSLFIA